MAQLVRCRSCGYVMEEAKLGEVCPACGVPRKMLEPWTDPVSPKRRTLLDLDLHPIVVHFPVAFTASQLVVAAFVLAFPAVLAVVAQSLLYVFAAVLPVMVIAGLGSGMYDGKLRFRRVTTPLLKRKIRLAGAFLVFSLAAAVITFVVPMLPTWVRALDVFLYANCLVCAVGLGKIGSRLVAALFPG